MTNDDIAFKTITVSLSTIGRSTDGVSLSQASNKYKHAYLGHVGHVGKTSCGG